MVRGALNEELCEDYCFECKDGGELRACDFRSCLKAYHPLCVQKDDSFLESDEHWTCDWHACFVCNKSSTYQCYCCPRSTCAACSKDAQFVPVKTKAFCSKCLRLAILIEENKDVDSEGEKVDFNEADESLFKDYWELVKDKERITLIDLHVANANLKSGGNCKAEVRPSKDASWFAEVETEISKTQNTADQGEEIQPHSGAGTSHKVFEVDGSEDNIDDAFPFLGDFKEGKPKRKKRTTNICKSNRRVFNGWGSEELLDFLESLGKDTQEPITQLDACDIIKDYIEEKNLYQHDGNQKKKKKYVVCDEKLYSLFRKKKFKQHKIYPLLQSHIAANNISDGEFSVDSEEDDDTFRPKKQRKKKIDSRSLGYPSTTRGKSYASGSLYASIVEKNIKSVYLKRSLVIDLLKDSTSFEDKVIGCFVRVKRDQNDFSSSNPFWLGKVIGVKKVQQPYKVGETSTDTVLCVLSYMNKDIRISSLSDEDFAEVECDELRQLVKKNRFKRPTVEELELKIRNVHADIINHWIAKEMAKLQKLIDRANEKGWRKELSEYIDKRELLRKPGERQRLLKEIPEVVADICENEDLVASAQKDGRQCLLKEIPEVVAVICENEDVAASTQKDSGPKFHDSPSLTGGEEGRTAKSIEIANDERVEESRAAKSIEIATDERVKEGRAAKSIEIATDERVEEGRAAKSIEIATDERVEEEVATSDANAAKEIIKENGAESNMNSPVGKRIGENGIEPLDNAAEAAEEMLSAVSGPHTVEVIEIEDDDNEEDPSPPTAPKMEATDQFECRDKIWHYFDPEGNEHGPFNMYSLTRWQNNGFFDGNFKIWRTGQSPKDAIPLKLAYKSCKFCQDLST